MNQNLNQILHKAKFLVFKEILVHKPFSLLDGRTFETLKVFFLLGIEILAKCN